MIYSSLAICKAASEGSSHVFAISEHSRRATCNKNNAQDCKQEGTCLAELFRCVVHVSNSKARFHHRMAVSRKCDSAGSRFVVKSAALALGTGLGTDLPEDSQNGIFFGVKIRKQESTCKHKEDVNQRGRCK